MPKWKPGDRVRIVERKVTQEDRTEQTYYDHLARLTGTVQNTYSNGEVAVVIDPDSFSGLMSDVHKTAIKRMRTKFIDSLSEEQKGKLTKEEKQFNANFVVLVRDKDLEKGPAAPKKQLQLLPEDDTDDDFDMTSVKEDVIYDDPTITGAEIRRPSTEDFLSAEEAEIEKRTRRN